MCNCNLSAYIKVHYSAAVLPCLLAEATGLGGAEGSSALTMGLGAGAGAAEVVEEGAGGWTKRAGGGVLTAAGAVAETEAMGEPVLLTVLTVAVGVVT
jgi:hypothetical protein